MKKVKVMLTAIAVLTIVGGSLAFKAKKGEAIRCVFTTATGAANKCVLAGTANIVYDLDNPTIKALTTATITTQPNGLPTCTNPGVGLYTLGEEAATPLQSDCLPRNTEIEQ